MPENTADRPAPQTIYLVGPSGHPNFGDEFIAAAWIRHLAQAHPDAQVWLDCPHPGQAAHLFAGLHPRLHFTDTLWRLTIETEHMAPDEAGAHIDRVVTELGSPRYDLGLLALRRANSVHLIGGGYINAIWPHHAGLLRAAVRLHELTGARLAATGLGLSPAADAQALRELLSRFHHASVRDAASAEISGAPLAPDDAFLGLSAVPGYTGTTGPAGQDGDVWVCLQSDMTDPATFDTAVAAVRTALEGPLAGRTVRYLEAIPGVDRAAFDRLADLIPAEHFLPFTGVWQDGLPAAAGQTWLTSRFHFHLLAAAAGAGGTALEISTGYYRTKHRSLLDIGTGWQITPAGQPEITAPTASTDFPAVAASLHQQKLAEAQQLYPTTGSGRGEHGAVAAHRVLGRARGRFLRR